ncbi:MAG: hypothetical protein ACRDQ4_01725 [Pseudonocardiaceae bacterium]
MLRLLDIQPGMRVMKIGTYSGYSGELLSRIIERGGHGSMPRIPGWRVVRSYRRTESARPERDGWTPCRLRTV